MLYLGICSCIPKYWKQVILPDPNGTCNKDITLFLHSESINLSKISLKALYAKGIRNETIKSAAHLKYSSKYNLTKEE